MEDENQHHVLVSVLLVQAKAHSIDEDLSKGVDNVKPFIARTGSFSKFLKRYNFSSSSSSSSCSGRIRFDSCSFYPQNEIGPSISSSVVLCVFVLLVYVVLLI